MSELIESASRIIDQVCETVCDDLCKYRDTTDDDLYCDYMREHNGECPLDKLR